MPKPKGGRGQRAPYQTKLIRVPVPLEQQVNELVERYQTYLESRDELDAGSPPNLLDFHQDGLSKLYKLLNRLGQHVESKDTGYRANSFAQGIKDIKQVIDILKLVNK